MKIIHFFNVNIWKIQPIVHKLFDPLGIQEGKLQIIWKKHKYPFLTFNKYKKLNYPQKMHQGKKNRVANSRAETRERGRDIPE